MATLLLSLAAASGRNYCPEVSIHAQLHKDGSATLVERWRIVSDEGTEGYLIMGDSGDTQLKDFSVSDETGRRFIYEGSWDVDRSRSQKAGRCGLHRTGSGVELCWGLGDYGDHTYTLSFTLTNIVKSMSDYDCLHWLFIPPGMDIAPRDARLTIEVDGHPVTDDQVLAWGFGFEGGTYFTQDGTLQFRSTAPFGSSSRMIALVRLPKGWIDSPSVREGCFQDVLDQAMEGADFDEFADKSSFIDFLMTFIFVLFPILIAIFGVWARRRDRKKVLGCKESEVQWYRDVPFEGDIFASEYLYNRVKGVAGHNNLTQAMILRMIYDGWLVITKIDGNKVELGFGKEDLTGQLNVYQKEFLGMLKEAAGSDRLLQHNEFSKWARRHPSTVDAWNTSLGSAGKTALFNKGLVLKTPECQKKAQEVIGFKKFLSDFTLVDQRRSAEVALWQDYLVYAALYGIANQVAKELSDIKPDIYKELTYGNTSMTPIFVTVNNYSTSVGNAVQRMHSGSSGHGGTTSFGGGGGFSGGFSGGGTR